MAKSGRVGLRTLDMSHFGSFLKESCGGVKETLFPWISGVKLQRFIDILAALFQGFVIRKIPELMKPGHRFAPMRNGALRIASRRVHERLFGLLVLERVEEGDALFDCGLHIRGATCGEIYPAQMVRLGRRARQSICLDIRGVKRQCKADNPREKNSTFVLSHGYLFLPAWVILTK